MGYFGAFELNFSDARARFPIFGVNFPHARACFLILVVKICVVPAVFSSLGALVFPPYFRHAVYGYTYSYILEKHSPCDKNKVEKSIWRL